MKDLKKIQEFFSKPLEENVDKKYSDFLVALRDSGITNMFGAAPYLQAEFGLDKREAREVLANWMRSFGESLNEGEQLDIVDLAKVVQAVHQTGHPVTVLLVPKFNEIEIITGMNAPDDMLRDLSIAVDSLGYGRNDIIIAGDSSNLSRREYSDIRRVNGGHKDYFEESINEDKEKAIKYFQQAIKLSHTNKVRNLILKAVRELGLEVPKVWTESVIDEAKKLTYNDFVRMVRDDMMAGAAPDERPSDELVGKRAKAYYNDYLQGASVDDLFEYNTGIYYDPAKERNAPKAKEASKTALEKVKDFIRRAVKEGDITVDDKTEFKLDLKHLLDKHAIQKEDISDYEKEGADYDKMYSDYLYKMVKEIATEKGYSKFLVSKDNPKGETSGLDTKTMNKILMNVIKDVEETIQLGKNLNEELCPKGKAYIKKRQAAGEKSSAYLSGRAVKVCKGQMKG